jgi:hypothetical protein
MRFSVALASLLATECVSAFSVTTPRSHPAFVQSRTHSKNVAPLKGLLDEINSDDYNLMGNPEEEEVDMNNAYEMFLGDLVFSTNDPRIDIMNDYERATDKVFLKWLEDKIGKSKDPDERMALRDLFEIIVDIKKRTELSKLGEERKAKEAEERNQSRIAEDEARAATGRQLSNTDVLKMAAAIGSTPLEEDIQEAKLKKTFYEEELTPEIRMSYEDQLKKFLPPYKAGETAATVVSINYDRFEAQFVKVLAERANEGEKESAILLEALAVEQQTRIANGAKKLSEVLSMGDPMRMEGAIVKMTREGGIDEAFLLLLEANETQARDAGATGAADLMKRLRNRAAEEKDKQMTSKEIRLIRKLLRADNTDERQTILSDAFTPRANLLVSNRLCQAKRKYHNFRFSHAFNYFLTGSGCRYSRKRCQGYGR